MVYGRYVIVACLLFVDLKKSDFVKMCLVIPLA